MARPVDPGRGRSPISAATRASFIALSLLPVTLTVAPGRAAASPLPTAPSRPRAAATFYVNFDGAVITPGTDDAPNNVSEVAEKYAWSGSYPAYGGSDAQRASVLAAVRADWAPFDVEIVDARPADAPYAMTLVGPLDPPFLGGFDAASPVDCWDENPNSLGFVFFGADDLGGAASSAVQAANVSTVFAHAAGLEHITGTGSEGDIMYPNPSSPTAAFLDSCFALAQGSICGEMHAQISGCAEAGQQNSYRELLDLFGPAQSDADAPSVEVAAPEDGDVFEAGIGIEVEVHAEDEVGVVEVELALDGESQGVLTEPPFSWVLDGVELGDHQLLAAARDAAGNETVSVPVNFTVADDESSGDAAGSGGGCGCAMRPRSGGGWGGLGLVGLVGLVGRRRIALRRID